MHRINVSVCAIAYSQWILLGLGFIGGEVTYDAGCDYGSGLCVEQVHETLLQFELATDGVGEEIGIDQDAVRRTEGFVGHEEHGGGRLRAGVEKYVSRIPRRNHQGRQSYISRLALRASSFFLASTSPAIWFFLLE